DYVKVRKSLLPPTQSAEDEVGGGRRELAGQEVFRRHGVKYLIHYDPKPGSQRQQQIIWLSLLSMKDEWAPLQLNGRVGVFVWKAPEEPADPYKNLRLDFDRLAFGPNLPAADKAPPQRPAHDPEQREWWSALWKPESPRPLAADESLLYLLH